MRCLDGLPFRVHGDYHLVRCWRHRGFAIVDFEGEPPGPSRRGGKGIQATWRAWCVPGLCVRFQSTHRAWERDDGPPPRRLAADLGAECAAGFHFGYAVGHRDNGNEDPTRCWEVLEGPPST